MPEVVACGPRHSHRIQDIRPPASRTPNFPESIYGVTSRIRMLVCKSIKISDFSALHPLLQRHLGLRTPRRSNAQSSASRLLPGAQALDQVSDGRRLSLINTILIALKACGIVASMRGNDAQTFDVRVGMEIVGLTVGEIDLTHQSSNPAHHEGQLPSPSLSIHVEPLTLIPGVRLAWEDTAHHKLEAFIESVVVNLMLAGEIQYREYELSHYRWSMIRLGHSNSNHQLMRHTL